MENIDDVIIRKIWTAEDLLPQAEEIVEKSKSLSPNKRKEISVTIGDWSEDRIKKHIETVREAVINPIRHKNKEKLKNIGVEIEKSPQEVFDDSKLIDKIATLYKNIKNIINQLTDILIDESLIERWLKESPDEVEQKLQDVVDAESSFKEIFEKEINEKFKSELLKRSLEDISFLESAEEIISNIEYLNSFGVLLGYTVEFEEFRDNLDTLSGKIKDIVEDFGISKGEIKQKIERKALSKACEIIEQLENECDAKKRKLLDEWKIYESTLKSFGDEIPEPPDTLPELEESVSSIKKRCLEHLGKSGFSLLKFLRGKEEFPDDITIGEIKKALEVLRPIFLKSLREEI